MKSLLKVVSDQLCLQYAMNPVASLTMDNTTLSLALGIIVSAHGQPLQILQVGFRSDSAEQ